MPRGMLCDSVAMPRIWFSIVAAAGEGKGCVSGLGGLRGEVGRWLRCALTSYCQRVRNILDGRVAAAVGEDGGLVEDLEGAAVLEVELWEPAAIGGRIGGLAGGVEPGLWRPRVENQRLFLRRRPELDIDSISCPGSLVEHIDLVLSPPQVRSGAGDGVDGGPDDAVASGDDGASPRRRGDSGR